MIIYGTRLFGKCDEIPGAGHVATQFFHVYFLPLIPMGSHFVIEGSKSGSQYKAIPLSLSWRSIGFAWLRASAALGLLFGIAGAFIVADSVHTPALGPVGAVADAVAMALLVWVSYRWARPSDERVLSLKKELGLATASAAAGPANQTPQVTVK